MNTQEILGIHHLTAVASDPQRNVDFYTGLLGLRLVKKTVNFDDPSAYHLYYGDEVGSPGTAITFFYWPDHSAKGRVGSGQSTRISFSASPDSLDYWLDRLGAAGVEARRLNRFGEEVVAFADPDGIPIEIVAVSEDARLGWTGGQVPAAHALRGMHTAELTVATLGPTEFVLTKLMGFRFVRREGNRSRYASGAGVSGTFADVIVSEDGRRGLGGAGTVHHIAWRVADDETEEAFQRALSSAGVGVSPVRDRSYFHSIYYREPAGILFEIATDQPGFTLDEPRDKLGEGLRLPSQFERHRAEIEKLLPPLRPAAVV